MTDNDVSTQQISDAQIERISDAVVARMESVVNEQVGYEIADIRREMHDELKEIRDETKQLRDELTSQERKFLANLRELQELANTNTEAVAALGKIALEMQAQNAHMTTIVEFYKDSYQMTNREINDVRKQVQQATNDAAYARGNSEDILVRVGELANGLQIRQAEIGYQMETVERIQGEIKKQQRTFDEQVERINEDVRPVADVVRWLQNHTKTGKQKTALSLGGLTVFLAGTYQIWQDFIMLMFGG